MSFTSRCLEDSICHVLGLGRGLEALVLGIGFGLGVSVMSAAVQLTLDRTTPEHHWKR